MADDTDTSPDKGTALWREITDFLRTDILDGHYQPGQALPGEAALARTYATSRPTIRKAIAQLAGEGLLTVAHGRGTFLRPLPDRMTIAIGRPPHEDLLSPAYDPTRQGWHISEPLREPSPGEVPTYALEPYYTPAGLDDANLFGIRSGQHLAYRYAFWQHQRTRARVMISSHTLLELVRTSRDDGEDVEPADYYAHLAKVRGPVTFTTSVHSRMPYGDAITDLAMEPIGTPLLVVRRTMLDPHGHVLEVTEIEAPGDRFEAAFPNDDRPLSDDQIALRL
ncbi:GntR family transcriptional regulator [Streptosporangiaceae bacterium NEAU-GS5]|nr:GntR family transcriptional regulator [Streptosporangiaceae bacterium NEAU-GS5]